MWQREVVNVAASDACTQPAPARPRQPSATSAAPRQRTAEQLVHHDARAPHVSPLIIVLLNDLQQREQRAGGGAPRAR